jgi:hypothetical protein
LPQLIQSGRFDGCEWGFFMTGLDLTGSKSISGRAGAEGATRSMTGLMMTGSTITDSTGSEILTGDGVDLRRLRSISTSSIS